MPCMGPVRRPELAAQATNDILLLLKRNYALMCEPLGKPNSKFTFQDKYKEQLRQLIEDIILDDDCATF